MPTPSRASIITFWTSLLFKLLSLVFKPLHNILPCSSNIVPVASLSGIPSWGMVRPQHLPFLASHSPHLRSCSSFSIFRTLPCLSDLPDLRAAILLNIYTILSATHYMWFCSLIVSCIYLLPINYILTLICKVVSLFFEFFVKRTGLVNKSRSLCPYPRLHWGKCSNELIWREGGANEDFRSEKRKKAWASWVERMKQDCTVSYPGSLALCPATILRSLEKLCWAAGCRAGTGSTGCIG